MKKQIKLWITWERQRRTIELSRALDIQLFMLNSEKQGLFRYFYLIIQTIKILATIKPQLLFVQNPSIILTFLVALLKPIFKYKLIVDRHTNFREIVLLNLGMKTQFKDRIHMILSEITLKAADLTIVTNPYLKSYVEQRGGAAFVLPDKIPEGRKANRARKISKKISFICSHSLDEPHEEVIKAASLIGVEIQIYITGNYRKTITYIDDNIPANVFFTGFISDQDYWNLLNESDIIMIFTKLDHCLLCGAYEAVAVGKPIIISKKKALSDYFYKGAVYVEHSPASIAKAIETIYHDYNQYLLDITDLKKEIETTWESKFKQLKMKL